MSNKLQAARVRFHFPTSLMIEHEPQGVFNKVMQAVNEPPRLIDVVMEDGSIVKYHRATKYDAVSEYAVAPGLATK